MVAQPGELLMGRRRKNPLAGLAEELAAMANRGAAYLDGVRDKRSPLWCPETAARINIAQELPTHALEAIIERRRKDEE